MCERHRQVRTGASAAHGRCGRRAESKTETWDYISKYEITCRSRSEVKHWNKFSAASTNCNSTTISISFSAALLVLPVRRMRNFQPENLSAFWNFANWISGANSSSNVRRKFCFCWIQTMLKYLCRILLYILKMLSGEILEYMGLVYVTLSERLR